MSLAASEYLPIAPFRALVEEELRRGATLAQLATRIDGVPAPDVYRSAMYRRLTAWVSDRHWSSGKPLRWVSWGVADRVVVGLLGPHGWHDPDHPELAALYEDEAA